MDDRQSAIKFVCLACLILLPLLVQARSPGRIDAGMFSAAGIGETMPEGWQPRNQPAPGDKEA